MGDPPPAKLPMVPPAAALPPIFGMQPTQKKPKAKSTTPTALTSEQSNPTNTGQKQLVGQ